MTNSLVCVDASVLLKLVLQEEDSEQTHSLWSSWVDDDIEVAAPYHLLYEATSVIRNRVYRREISVDAGQQAFDAFLAQTIAYLHPESLSKLAWTLAAEFDRTTAYDTHYVALAQLLDCDFWTADRRLHNAVSGRLPYVRLLREHQVG